MEGGGGGGSGGDTAAWSCDLIALTTSLSLARRALVSGVSASALGRDG
jgi:hypothetical protein